MPRAVILLTLWAVTILFVTWLIFIVTDKGCCLQYVVEGERVTEKAVETLTDCKATCYIYISKNAARINAMTWDNRSIYEDERLNQMVNHEKESITRNNTVEDDKINPYVNALFDFCDYIKKKVYNKWKSTLLNFKQLSVPKASSKEWNLRSVSLFRRNSIVVCELTWLPQMALALYHVTWEVEGGWVKGHMFTDVARVKLSLWSGTRYKVTVRLLLSTRIESESLVVDTGKISGYVENDDPIGYASNNDVNIVMLDVYNGQTVTLFLFTALACIIILLFVLIRLKLGRADVGRSVLMHNYRETCKDKELYLNEKENLYFLELQIA